MASLNPNIFVADPAAYLREHGWTDVRLLPTGEWAGLQKMMFTTALAVGLNWSGYRTRFCYDGPKQMANAKEALALWNGTGFPPGYWLKQKPEDLMNPAR